MTHRTEGTLRERLLAMLAAGPLDRRQIDTRLGSKSGGAAAIKMALMAGEIERVPGETRGAWQRRRPSQHT